MKTKSEVLKELEKDAAVMRKYFNANAGISLEINDDGESLAPVINHLEISLSGCETRYAPDLPTKLEALEQAQIEQMERAKNGMYCNLEVMDDGSSEPFFCLSGYRTRIEWSYRRDQSLESERVKS